MHGEGVVVNAKPTFAQAFEYFVDNSTPPPANQYHTASGDQATPDSVIRERMFGASNGAKTRALWDGGWQQYYPSQSEADFALINIIWYFCRNDIQAKRMFESAPSYRFETYGNRPDLIERIVSRASDRAASPGDFSAITHKLTAMVNASAAPSWPEFGPISEDEWTLSKSSPRAIIEDLIYEDVGVLIAAGGMGKTTLTLAMAIHVVLGIEFCGHGVSSPGPVVILTAEDSREMLVARLRKIATAMFPHGTIDAAERAAKIAAIRNGVIIVDVSARVQRLTLVDRDVVRVDDAAVDGLAAFLAPLQPSLLLIDPAVSFGVGEGRVNDAEQGLIEAGRRLRRALACAVIYIHHTGKANARDKTEDQYSGRGGSAFADGSRMVIVMNRLTPKDWHDETGGTLEPGEVGLKLNIAKLSYVKPQRPLYLIRNGYRFDHIEVAVRTDDDRDATDDETAFAFIASEFAKAVTLSRRRLEEAKVMPRARLRNAITRLLETGRIVEHVEPGKATALIPGTPAAPVGEGG